MSPRDDGLPEKRAGLDAPLLRTRGLTKRYGGHIALDRVDLDVAEGEFLTILGPSGSGKTTLLRLIGGFVEPSAGEVLLEGADVSTVPIERRPFNTVFQDYALFPHMTVERNIGYGLSARGMPKAEIAKKVREHLDVVGLTGMERRTPGQLSGGQKQRVALARALVCAPRLLLLDEPLSALDAGLRRQMQHSLKTIQRRVGVTFLLVTHDQEEAIALSDRICVMRDGRIEQIGDPSALYWRPRNRFVATFFGETNLIEGRTAPADHRTIETGLGPIRLSAGAPRAAGARATLSVRPETLAFAEAGAEASADAPVFEAEIAEIDFAGATTSLRLAGPGGLLLLMRTMSRPVGAEVSPGAKVRIRLDAAAVAALSDEPA